MCFKNKKTFCQGKGRVKNFPSVPSCRYLSPPLILGMAQINFKGPDL